MPSDRYNLMFFFKTFLPTSWQESRQLASSPAGPSGRPAGHRANAQKTAMPGLCKRTILVYQAGPNPQASRYANIEI